jgi:hypothetical protein
MEGEAPISFAGRLSIKAMKKKRIKNARVEETRSQKFIAVE